MPFYIIERYYKIEGKQIRFVHNVITGAKRLYVDSILENEVITKFLEWGNALPVSINGTSYELIITPKWHGGFDYKVQPRRRLECGYGTSNDALLDEAQLDIPLLDI